MKKEERERREDVGGIYLFYKDQLNLPTLDDHITTVITNRILVIGR